VSAAEARLMVGTPGDPRAWVRVANTLLDGITSGQFKPGQAVPSRNDLAHRFGVSPITAARGVRELAGMRIICRVPGLGYYVSVSFALAMEQAIQDGSLTAVPSGAAGRRAVTKRRE
jgi:DNA-binding GntR family transcriptional regulator